MFFADVEQASAVADLARCFARTRGDSMTFAASLPMFDTEASDVFTAARTLAAEIAIAADASIRHVVLHSIRRSGAYVPRSPLHAPTVQ